MTTRGKILLFTGITAVVGGTFYLFYWRTRNAVKATDVPVLQQYVPTTGIGTNALASTTPATVAASAPATGPAAIFSGIVPILTPQTV